VETFQDNEPEQYLSALPFLPPITEKTLNTYYTFYAAFVAAMICFGALLAPLLEVKIGLGGAGAAGWLAAGALGEGRRGDNGVWSDLAWLLKPRPSFCFLPMITNQPQDPFQHPPSPHPH